MKSFKQFVNEARRNPELNPKVGATDYLRKYKDRDDIYISFTKINKVGVNPKTFENFNTPAGVYTYPLKEFWKFYDVDNRGTVKMAAPFAGRRPYIQILKGKHTKGFIQDISKYTQADLVKDQQKILSYVKDEYARNRFKEEIIDNADSKALVKTSFGKFWYITDRISKFEGIKQLVGIKSQHSPFAWTELLRKMGYTGFADVKGQGILYPSEPVQAVFIDPREYEQIDMIENKEHKIIIRNKDDEFEQI